MLTKAQFAALVLGNPFIPHTPTTKQAAFLIRDELEGLYGGSAGGGGQFILRGQDLLLSVNRAQKAGNIKGQSISLA